MVFGGRLNNLKTKKDMMRLATVILGIYALLRNDLATIFETPFLGPINLAMVLGVVVIIYAIGSWRNKW